MAKKLPLQNPFQKVAVTLRDLQDRHEERHRPSGFNFAFSDRIDLLNPSAWDRVTQKESLFLRRQVLRLMEEHRPKNLVPRYAIVCRGEEPVAVMAAQIVSVTGEHFRSEAPIQKKGGGNLLKRALSPAGKMMTANLNERLLVAGNLMSFGFHGIAFAPGEEPAQIWPGVADALYRIRRAERLEGQTNVVIVKDITEKQNGLESLRRFSYRRFETEPNMVLKIDAGWRDYNDYLSALDAKYRRNAKDQLKRLAEAGCTIECLSGMELHAKRLYELYLAVHRNASVRLVTLAENYLPRLSVALGNDFRCHVVRRGDEILGFVTTLRDGPTAIAYYIGFDRTAAESLPIYIRLLHATIGDAIEWGCTHLSLGRTALEPKAAMGAKPEPMSVWMRHRIPAMNWMLHGVLGTVSHDEAPERNPFKTVAPAQLQPMV